jgi:oligopeptide/dipeptide ABC transporter ATP-binding protein
MNALNPVMTVEQQILEAILVHQIHDQATGRRRVRELLDLVGLPKDSAARYPHEFSGGMRQRAAIAMALACDPSVLLADEPTTALDVMVQAQILQLLTDLSNEFGLALVLVSHDLPLVAETCQRIAVMYAGRIVEVGSAACLRDHPRHPYTQRLFDAVPDLYDERPLSAIPGAPPHLDQPVTGCAFAARCEEAWSACSTVPPDLYEIDKQHLTECHLHAGAPKVAS